MPCRLRALTRPPCVCARNACVKAEQSPMIGRIATRRLPPRHHGLGRLRVAEFSEQHQLMQTRMNQSAGSSSRELISASRRQRPARQQMASALLPVEAARFCPSTRSPPTPGRAALFSSRQLSSPSHSGNRCYEFREQHRHFITRPPAAAYIAMAAKRNRPGRHGFRDSAPSARRVVPQASEWKGA